MVTTQQHNQPKHSSRRMDVTTHRDAAVTATGMLEFTRSLSSRLEFDASDTSLRVAVALVSNALTKVCGLSSPSPNPDPSGTAVADSKAKVKVIEIATETIVAACVKHNGFLHKIEEEDTREAIECTWIVVADKVALIRMNWGKPVFQLVQSKDGVLKSWWASMTGFRNVADQYAAHHDLCIPVVLRITCAVAFMVALCQRDLSLPCGIVSDEHIQEPTSTALAAFARTSIGFKLERFSAVKMLRFCTLTEEDETDDSEEGRLAKELGFCSENEEVFVANIEFDSIATISSSAYDASAFTSPTARVTEGLKCTIPGSDSGFGSGLGPNWDTPENVATAFETINTEIATACLHYDGLQILPSDFSLYHFMPFESSLI